MRGTIRLEVSAVSGDRNQIVPEFLDEGASPVGTHPGAFAIHPADRDRRYSLPSCAILRARSGQTLSFGRVSPYIQ